MSRELDAEVAEKVMTGREHVDNDEGFCEACGLEMMEWRLRRWKQQGGKEPEEVPCIPKYSTNISAAMEVVEKFRRNDPATNIVMESGSAKWGCQIWTTLVPARAIADTLPEAICHAALATLTKEQK